MEQSWQGYSKLCQSIPIDVLTEVCLAGVVALIDVVIRLGNDAVHQLHDWHGHMRSMLKGVEGVFMVHASNTRDIQVQLLMNLGVQRSDMLHVMGKVGKGLPRTNSSHTLHLPCTINHGVSSRSRSFQIEVHCLYNLTHHVALIGNPAFQCLDVWRRGSSKIFVLSLIDGLEQERTEDFNIPLHQTLHLGLHCRLLINQKVSRRGDRLLGSAGSRMIQGIAGLFHTCSVAVQPVCLKTPFALCDDLVFSGVEPTNPARFLQ